MINDDVIYIVYRKFAGRVSLSNVRSILELFEETLANKSKPPLELRNDEQVFVEDSYNRNTQTYKTLEEAVECIREIIEDYEWNVDEATDYIKVFVGRKVNLKVSQETIINLS